MRYVGLTRSQREFYAALALSGGGLLDGGDHVGSEVLADGEDGLEIDTLVIFSFLLLLIILVGSLVLETLGQLLRDGDN